MPHAQNWYFEYYSFMDDDTYRKEVLLQVRGLYENGFFTLLYLKIIMLSDVFHTQYSTEESCCMYHKETPVQLYWNETASF